MNSWSRQGPSYSLLFKALMSQTISLYFQGCARLGQSHVPVIQVQVVCNLSTATLTPQAIHALGP